MKFYLILLFISMLTPPDKIKVWKERGGNATFEAEHIQTRNDLPLYWSRAREVGGYSGTGYLYWGGTSFLRDDYEGLDDERILEYYVSIQKEGVYFVKIKGLCIDEYESQVLVRIKGSDWHQYVVRNENAFSWDVNERKALCSAFLQMGYHKIELAGISSGFMVDRFEMIHESELNNGEVDISILDGKESSSEYLKAERF